MAAHRRRNSTAPILLGLALHRWRIRIFDFHPDYGFRNSSGSLAILAAIRLA
jgi:hypothetical protein